jgi:hypothetical protein
VVELTGLSMPTVKELQRLDIVDEIIGQSDDPSAPWLPH